VLIITHIAGYGLLAAIMLLYVRTGSFLWMEPAVGAAFSGAIVLLMIVAAMAKSVMYPLHTWIPEVMNASTPVSALLHSACYVKAGAYLIARMYLIGLWHGAFGNFLLLVGCLTMLESPN
jgi:multicomponent K+:H+ antiporter subunit A